MGYNKIISYGNTLEVYEYEKDIIRLVGRTRREPKTADDTNGLGTDGKDTLSKTNEKDEVGKRSDNARRASLAFRRIVASNLTDLSEGYRHLTTFIQTLRRRYGKAFSYILVPEFQKRGAVHFHALFWGLPEDLLLHERETRTLSEIWGQGFVFIKPTDGNEKLAFYLSKYFTKAFMDPRLKNQKSYVASRNIKRPLEQKGPFIIPVVLEEFGVVDEPVVERKYHTKWLGEARFRIFKFNNDQS